MLKNVVLQYYFSISVHVSGYLDTSALSFASTFPRKVPLGQINMAFPCDRGVSLIHSHRQEPEKEIYHPLPGIFFFSKSFIQRNGAGCKVNSFSPLILEGH